MFKIFIVILCLLLPVYCEAKTFKDFCNGCVTIKLNDTEEYWSNALGGIKKKGSYLGSTTVSVNIDIGKALSTSIGTFYISAIDIRGSPMSNSNLQTLDFISSTENYHSHRLYEFYYDQKFKNIDIKVGKIDFFSFFEADNNFAKFDNASMITSMVINNNTYNMTNYGPSSSPGIIVKYSNKNFYIEGGLSSDNPYGGNYSTDFYNHNTDRYGTDIIFKGPMLYLEFMKRISYKKHSGIIYVGGIYDFGKQPITYKKSFHKENSAYYFVVDQNIYNDKGNLNVFFRYMTDPYNSRTDVKYTIDTGLIYENKNYYIGSSFSLTHSNKHKLYQHSDHNEYRLEFMYGLKISDNIVFQPDIQYIIHPGALRNFKNELVIGYRVIFSY